MRNPDPGYLLPDGEAYTDDFACQLIFIPNKDEYWRAMLGAILYMGTWTAWERDSAKRGQNAAQAWREANELTMECWRMTNCLDDINLRLDAIIAFMLAKKDCCDDNLTYGTPTEVDTEIVPNEGTDPDYYGETSVADWEEWLEYLCYNANLWVDELIRQAETVSTGLSIGAIALGLVAASMTLLAYLATGGFVYAPDVMLIARGLITGADDSMFSQAAADLEDARDSIVCALIEGRDVAWAVENALSISATWSLFFQHIDYDSATAILYEGGNNGIYLPAEKLISCSCLCHHLYSTHPATTINSATAVHSNLTMTSRTVPPPSPLQHYSVTLVFNYDGDVCGPTKTLLTATTSDGLKMSRLITYDDEDNVIDDFDSPTDTCTEDISLLNNTPGVRKLYIERTGPSIGGCGVAAFDVDFTYEDDI